MRPITVYLHFNKQGSKDGYPWTVHTSKACIPAKSVTVFTPMETVFKPKKKTNPRAFLKTKGYVSENNGHVHIIDSENL